MSVPSSVKDEPAVAEPRLVGEVVAFVGKLEGMTRQEAIALVRQHGGALDSSDVTSPTLVVIGDNQPDLESALQADNPTHLQIAGVVNEGSAKLLRESELWERLGLVGNDPAEAEVVQRLYTPAMLAELLGVPVAAIRRWHRKGTLVACRSVRKLPYFDFAEVAVARHLAAMLTAGCSLAVIDRKLRELHRSMPEVARPLCEPSIVVVGRQLILRRGDELTEPGGQFLIDFDRPSECDEQGDVLLSVDQGLQDADAFHAGEEELLSTADQLHMEALKWEDQGPLRGSNVIKSS